MKTQRREGAFRGFGRVPTQPHGSFRFKTFKPAFVPAPDGTLQAPHLAVFVFTRELLCRLVTRIYFPDEPSNAEDFAFKLVVSHTGFQGDVLFRDHHVNAISRPT
jgi:protocatechuate 3,4-dioxygenase, alpha subunit